MPEFKHTAFLPGEFEAAQERERELLEYHAELRRTPCRSETTAIRDPDTGEWREVAKDPERFAACRGKTMMSPNYKYEGQDEWTGERITAALIRLFCRSPRAFGYKGDVHAPSAVQEWASELAAAELTAAQKKGWLKDSCAAIHDPSTQKGGSR